MGNTVVGIKTAQGEFFPILDPAAGKKRRVVLVPSREGQENVKIQLFERHENDPEALLYLSSIFLENIGKPETGDSEIELVLSSDAEMNIYVTAKDLVTGEQKSISVAARDAGTGDFTIPAAEFDSLSGVMPLTGAEEETEPVVEPPAENFIAGEEFGVGKGGKPAQHGVRPLYLAAFVLVGLFLILLIAYLILRGTQVDVPAEAGAVLNIPSPGTLRVAACAFLTSGSADPHPLKPDL